MLENLSERFDAERVNIGVKAAILVDNLVSQYVRPAHRPLLLQYDVPVVSCMEFPANQSLERSSSRLQTPVDILYLDILSLQQ